MEDSDNSTPSITSLNCPVPLPHNQRIVLSHGSGGKRTYDLVKKVFLSNFETFETSSLNDSAILPIFGKNIALTTDSHVVSPLFFPGGDIGRLAVCGTVNDLAMVGATPVFLTAGFILEEGLEIRVLEKIVSSMQTAALESGVKIIAGDTKVVQKNKADGLYITTSGFGIIPDGITIRGDLAKPGDIVIVSGSIGEHGVAVLTARGELGFDSDVLSDVSPLNDLVAKMISATKEIHVLRDPTRGGLATTLNEIAQQSAVNITIYENRLVVKENVRATCEFLGFDPLYIANEGKLIAIIPPQHSESILRVMHNHPYGKEAAIIGEVKTAPEGRVLLKTNLGSTQILDMLSGELLPRIC